MAGRLLSNELFTLQILCYTASYRGDKALEGSGRGSLMSTSHLDSEVDTDLEEFHLVMLFLKKYVYGLKSSQKLPLSVSILYDSLQKTS